MDKEREQLNPTPTNLAGGDTRPQGILSKLKSAFTKIRPKPENLEAKLFSNPTQGLSDKEAAKVDKKIEEFSKHVEKAEELDAEIVRLQQASRTSFKAFRKLHVYLCVRNKLYNHLHSSPYASQLNIGALVVYIVSLSVGIGTFYTPALKYNDKPVFVTYIQASTENDSAVLVGSNENINIGFSDKEAKTAGVLIKPAEGKVSDAENYELGVHLLADGLDIPPSKQLGTQTSWLNSITKPNNRIIQSVNAQEASATADLPPSTVAHIEVDQSNPQMVTYEVTDAISLRYQMNEWKTKETIAIRKPEALKGNTLSFALSGKGLVFKADTDGSWQAFREEDKDQTDRSSALFRLYKPTIEDKDHKEGQISMAIDNDKAIYTIDPEYLKTAVFPLMIDPTISPSGRTCTWSNGAGTNVWATAGNWSCTSASGPPAAGDAVVFDTTSNTNANAATGTVADDIYSLTFASGYSSIVTLAKAPIVSNDGTPDNYKWDLETVTLNNGHLVLTGDPTVNPTPIPAGCSVSVKCGRGIEINANTVTIGSSASINADSLGFAAGTGPGLGGGNASGGSYGGKGGYGTTGGISTPGSTYGSVTQPTSLGSGGVQFTAGGGAVKLSVSGTLTNNGRISADGAWGGGSAPAGSGGSVYISASTYAGTGLARAEGGTVGSSGGGGPGGGGRVAIYATTMSNTGSRTAFGGVADTFFEGGGNGTVYLKTTAQTYGTLQIANGDRRGSLLSSVGATLPAGTYTFDAITLNDYGVVDVGDGATLDMTIPTITGDSTGRISHSGTGILITGSSLTIDDYILAENTSAIGSVTDLTIADGGVLDHTGNTTTEVNKLNLSLTNLTIQSGGRIDTTGMGYWATAGPGYRTASGCYPTGGSYGGTGGPGGDPGCTGTLGATYGSSTAPTSLGSGNEYMAGGGAVILTISGTLTNNGSIIADGVCCTGGGSGGSIYITANALAGNGLIAARGGGTVYGGSGGGGRVAVYVTGSTDTFSGTKTAAAGANLAGPGGGPTWLGSDGTVVSQHYPVTSVTTPTNNATNQSQNLAVSFSATDAESDYYRARVAISTASDFSTSCTFTQTAATSTFSAGTCSGSYSTFAGSFTNMNYDSDSSGASDMYTSGRSGVFTFSNDLAQGTTYYLRVNTCDPGGSCGGQSDTFGTVVSRTFTVSAISKLIFTTSGSDTTCTDTSSGQTIVAHQVSTIYNIQVCNGLDEAVKLGGSQTINLSSNAGTGIFSSSSSGSPTITTVSISSGNSGASFYYTDTAVGTPTLTAAPQGQSWTSATQQQSFVSDTPTRINIGISGSPTTAQAGAALTVTVTAYDQYSNVATGFTGSKTVRFAGANNATAAGPSTITPTVTNSGSTAIAFGSDTAITFTNGVSQTRTMVLKLTEAASLTVTDYTSGSAGITSTTTPYAIQVTPADLSYFTATKYPQSSAGQFATAGFPWNSTGLAGGSQAPYDTVVTAYDAYANIKYDYTGDIWFTMDSGKVYSFPYDAISNACTFTWNSDHVTHAIRTTTGSSYDNGRHIFNSADFTVTTGGSSQALYLNGTGGVVTTLQITIRPSNVGQITVSFSPSLTSDVVDTALNSDVVVTAYDVLGNVKTDYTGSIAFSSTDPSATLPYTSSSKYTFTDTDLGAHTFDKSTFAFGTGGNHTITVTDNTSDNTTVFSSTTNEVVVPVHTVSQLDASAGHQSATLSWLNPADTAIVKANIYQSTSSGSLGTKLATTPSVNPSTVTQFNATGLTNGTTYYYTVKLVHLNPSAAEIESAASTQVSVTPADIAPRSVSASQGSDGRITITYGLRYDSTIGISYYNPSTNLWTSASTAAMSGDVGAAVGGSEAITSHTAYFTPSVDFPNKYFVSSQGFKVAIDVSAQSSTVRGESNTFLLDTNPPRVNTGEHLLVVDATGNNTATLTLLAREDGATEQAIEYRISNSSDMSNATSWSTLSTKPTSIAGWNLSDAGGVTVQYRDPYSNITTSTNSILSTPTNFGLKDGSNPDSGDYRLVLIWTDPSIPNFSKFIIDRSTDGANFTQHDTSNKNGYLDVNLVNTQRYYYRIKSQDSLGNISRPTTVLSSQPGGAPGVTAKPEIDVQAWKQEFGVRATVKWSTDQLSDSFVVYAKKPLAEGTSTLTTDGDAAQVVGQFDNTLDHEVLVQQLEPSTDYYFKTLSQNEIKIAGASEIVKITTPQRVPLTISGLSFENTTPSSTQAVWTTNKPSTTLLEFGTTTSYGLELSDTNANINHNFTLDKLTSGATYNLRILATDVDGNTTTSDNYKVTIPAIPTISDIRVSELSEKTATIVWTTNVNTDSNVEFGTGGGFQSQQGKSDTTTLHTVTIIGLLPATSYSYRVRSSDQFANVAVSGTLSFTTPKDATPPVISNVKGELSTAGEGDRLKITGIISWDTDEPATSQIEFGAGIPGEFPEKTIETATFNQSSTVFLRELKANSSYNYRVVSKDAAGNISRSEAYTLLTPAKRKDIGALLLQALGDQFKWVNKLQEKFRKR